jgi:putative methionine-R-sulfoxide reductase with GAF domain
LVVGKTDRSERTRALADEIRARGGYRWVGVYDLTETAVAIIAWSGGGPPAYPRFPRDQGLTSRAITTRDIVIVDDVEPIRITWTRSATRAPRRSSR